MCGRHPRIAYGAAAAGKLDVGADRSCRSELRRLSAVAAGRLSPVAGSLGGLRHDIVG